MFIRDISLKDIKTKTFYYEQFIFKIKNTVPAKTNLDLIYSVICKNETYSHCDELICNPSITGYFGTNQFADSLVPCWHNAYGSSQLTRAAYSAPSAGEVWSAYYNPDLVCSSCAWESGLKKTKTDPGVGDEKGNITNNNTYIDDCKNFLPASNYK